VETFFKSFFTFLFGRKEKPIRIRSKRKAWSAFRTGSCEITLSVVLTHYLLEKFLKWGMGRNFFQEVPPQGSGRETF
jgi:hypothetical protein